MVSIGNTNWSLQGALLGQQTSRGITFGGNSGSNGTLMQRLEAIDRGDSSAIVGGRANHYGGFAPDTNLMARLDAIGTGELSPKSDSNFDIYG